MSARNHAMSAIGDMSTAASGGETKTARASPGSASHRVRPADVIARRRLVAGIAEALQHTVMRTDRLPESRAAVVGHAVLGGQALDDRAQLPVVNVADPREQMVLDLIVQPADVPGQEPVAAREIVGRPHLIEHPSALERARLML